MSRGVISDPDRTALPPLLQRYTNVGLAGLVAGTLLCLLALFTNPVPDPSFEWATLPESLLLPVRQPRLEHWPVSYTVGIWLWVACFPALFVAGYRRFVNRVAPSRTVWFVGLPTAAMLAWTTYCRFFWPKLHPASWNAPSYTVVCWLYCSSYDVLWSNAAYAVALLGVVATGLHLQRRWGSQAALLGFGLLSLPLGLPALSEWYRRHGRTLPD